MHFGEYELSPSLIGLSHYPQVIRKLFNAYWCGPPAGVTQPSTWPRVDHLVSRLPVLTRRRLPTRFRFGSGPEALSLANTGNS